MKPIEWLDNKLKIIDQTKLPGSTVFIEITDYLDVVEAIKELKVRGAPAIGVAAGYGIALGAHQIKTENKSTFQNHLDEILKTFAASRPTAVNLFRTIDRMKRVAANIEDPVKIARALTDEAKRIHSDEIEATKRLSKLGAELIKDGFTIMTRPLCQGARLTTWELLEEKIPVTLITDSMAGYFLSRGQVNCIIVGADRIAANGDVANKIGTYTLAVLATENKVPFYVAAPTSTIDLSLNSGVEIPIEERDAKEIMNFAGTRIAPHGISIANPAFDVTPNRYITAIITEKGIINQPYENNLSKILEGAT
jgi:methylthioribose-1-phosphate isomerase